MQPLRAAFSRLNRQRLQRVRQKKLSALFGFFGMAPDTLSRRYDKETEVIPMAVFLSRM